MSLAFPAVSQFLAVTILHRNTTCSILMSALFQESLRLLCRDNIWKWWRNAPGFSQRYTGTIVDGGNTIIGKGELSKDGSTWEKDLDLTYKRVE